VITEAVIILTADPLCARYVVFKGRNPGVYTSWAECSKHVMGYSGAVHRKYTSYEQAIADFNSTINTMPSSKPSSSLVVTQIGETASPMSYKNVSFCSFVLWLL